ncbi:hypothetical protein M2282_006136, partial [Variovorax boronicumulans]|nr:hypothetical protein [Variovorax boronicumulans]
MRLLETSSLVERKKPPDLRRVAFELLASMLAHASVKSESVTDTEVVAGRGLRGEATG